MSAAIETNRLVLRPWRDDDLSVFAAMNADPKVMEFFPAIHSEDQSRQMLRKLQTETTKRGFGFWACERKDEKKVIGFVGLWVPDFHAHFTPCVEVGWRLLPEHWGQGFATEAAVRSLEFGFQNLNLNEIVSFTSIHNLRSQKVMQKIGMVRSISDDFDHPTLEEGHWLRRHVLYRMSKANFDGKNPS